MSHQIDFESHGLSDAWNGYRAYPEWVWKIIHGRQPYLINRQPYSVHKNLMLENGLALTLEMKRQREDGIPRSKLSQRWREITDDDLMCAGAFVQARRVF